MSTPPLATVRFAAAALGVIAATACAAPLIAQEAGSADPEPTDTTIVDVDTLPPDPDAVDPGSAEVAAAADSAEAWLRLVDDGNFQAAWAAGASTLQVSGSPRVLAAAVAEGRGRFEPPATRSLIGFRMVRNPPNAAPGDYVLLRYRARPTEGPVLIETVSTKLEGSEWRVVGYDAFEE